MTTTFEETTTSQHCPSEGAGCADAAREEHFPPLFWAAIILFVVNLIVLFGIWISPELRVGMHGENEGMLAGSYSRPSPFTERVEIAKVRKPKAPEKVRPILYQESDPVSAELFNLGANPQVAAERSVQIRESDRNTDNLDDLPRITASTARPGDQARHVGSVDIAPRRATEQP